MNRESRKEFLDLVPDEIYTKILIQTHISDEELEKRLKKREEENATSKNWLKFHYEMRQDLYEKASD